MRLVGQCRSGTQTAKGSETSLLANDRTFKMTERQNLCLRADLYVFEHAVCANTHTVTQHNSTAEYAANVNCHILAAN